jgi:hypothetical protein
MGWLPKVKPLPLLGFLFILLIAYWVVAGSSPVSNLLPSEKRVVTCQATISNALFMPLKIDSYNCQQGNKCYSLMSLSKLSIIPSDSGYLQLFADDGAKSGNVDVKVTEQLLTSSSKTYEVSACTTSTTGNIKLYDKKSQILQQEAWTVN